ncbi:MAG: virulence-associated E family protein [Flavobacteriaceae bacterium]|nr:MAG: virulence-associated E family protein [Flavobacteriaceae bacterium]
MNEEKLYITTSSNITVYDRILEFTDKKYDILYNEISQDFEISFKNKKKWTSLNLNSLLIELTKVEIKTRMSTLEVFIKSDEIKTHNPFKSYFKQLNKWDGIDYISKLASYVPTKEPILFKYHLKKWMVRTVKCALKNKYFNKQALILVHDEQNTGKTTFCRFLCPIKLTDYIAENIGYGKDSNIQLTRNFLINLDELDKIEKKEINGYKSMFSKIQVNLRLPYDRRNTNLPRTCSFVGSTNHSNFLEDETGSVRWLCFELSDIINFNYSKDIDIDDVWAQAYHLANDPNFNSELTIQDIKQNEERNDKYKVLSVEEELIYENYTKSDDLIDFKTTATIVQEISNIYPKANNISIGKAIRSLGFERIKNKKTQRWGYLIRKA